MNVVVIPARFGSTRFPGKPLALIQGRPMIWHVYQRSQKAKMIDEVWVATDDQRIYQAVKAWGGKVVMTRPDHVSGTDRVAEAVSRIPCDLVVNVQGDEPLIDPEIIDAVVTPLARNPSLGIVTPVARIEFAKEIFDPSVAKVVRDAEGFALYFSRAPIPYDREAQTFRTQPGGEALKTDSRLTGDLPYLRHIGLYAFHKKTLLNYCQLPPSPLERIERLEQLRALEYGIPIYTVLVDYHGIAVDEPGDIRKVEEALWR